MLTPGLCLLLRQMAEMSPEKKSNALPNALVKDEEEGVAKAAGKLEQPEPRKYKWLAALFMWVAFVSILANGGQAIANATKPVGTHAQKHVYAVGLTSRLNSAGGSVVAMVPCVEVSEAIASLQNGDSDQGLVMVPLPGGEFLTPSMSAAHYQVHEDSFGIEQIFPSGDDDVSYNVSCETSMAACDAHPGLLCDVLPSVAITASSPGALSFEDAFDGDVRRRLTHAEDWPLPHKDAPSCDNWGCDYHCPYRSLEYPDSGTNVARLTPEVCTSWGCDAHCPPPLGACPSCPSDCASAWALVHACNPLYPCLADDCIADCS